MSPIPDNPPPDEPPADEFDMRAAEFVLGTLEEDQRRSIEAERLLNPKLAAAIDYWEARLAPMADSVAPAAPPPDLWQRIEAGLPPVRLEVASQRSAPAKNNRPRLTHSLRFWRVATVAATALAASLAGILLLTPPSITITGNQIYAAAIVAPTNPAPLWLAETERDGSVVVLALGKAERPSGKDLELWALPSGATRPISLGVLPASGRYVVPARDIAHPAHLQLLVSLEPKGGSPTGQPTGPVLYGGELTATN